MNRGEDLFGSVYKRGDVIIRQGDAGDTMYIIQSGAVEVSQRQGDKEVLLALLERGDFFGEMSLLDDQPRSATVTALRRTRLLAVSRSSLLAHLREDPGVALHILKTVSHRIEKNNRLLKKRIEGGEARGSPSPAAPERNGEPDSSNVPLSMASPEQNRGRPGRPREAFSSNVVDSDCVWVEPQHVLFWQGDPGDTMYVIVEGAVEIVYDGTLLARLGQNDYLGEMALFTNRPRTATATSTCRTKLLPIKRDDFMVRIRQKPELALYILQTLIKRLRKTSLALTTPKGSFDSASMGLPTLLSRSGKVSVAVVSLSTCSGCASMLIDDNTALAELMERANIVYCPLLMDEYEFVEADIAIVDGLVRSKEDEEELKKVRRKSAYLVSWGTCATFGGIPAMANQYELEDLIDEAYGQAQDTFAYYLSGAKGVKATSYRDAELALLRRAIKLDDVVKVDYYVPGCPPRAHILTGLIQELMGEQCAESKMLVCTDCGRKPQNNTVDRFLVFPRPDEGAHECFSAHGSLCLGFLTRGGCGTPCTAGGLPCWGCRGPSDSALQKIGTGETLEGIMLDSLVRKSKLDEAHIRPLLSIIRNRANSSLNFYANHTIDAARIR